MISTAFGLVQTLLTFITMIALLVVVSPLLAVIALLSPIPAFIADTRYGWRGYNIARWGSRLLRRVNNMGTFVDPHRVGKKVKLLRPRGALFNPYPRYGQARLRPHIR